MRVETTATEKAVLNKIENIYELVHGKLLVN